MKFVALIVAAIAALTIAGSAFAAHANVVCYSSSTSCID